MRDAQVNFEPQADDHGVTLALDFPEPDIKADPGQLVHDVCEGCGPGWFDENGKRVTDEETTAPDGPQQ